MLLLDLNQALEAMTRSLLDFWSNFGGYVSLIGAIAIILLVFWVLLGEKYESKVRQIGSLFLILVGLVLTLASPFNKELNTIMVAALFSPIVAYIVSVLKSKQDFSSEVDRQSHEYRRKQVEIESNVIGELLGELSTHAAAFKSYGTQEIDMEKWRSSFKVGLISDIHTLSIARYYYFVPIYNRIVKVINESAKQKGNDKIEGYQRGFSDVKKAFLDTETAIFHTLIFDLGLLQQSYLARPTVRFPLHMTFLLKKQLEKFGIIKESDEIEPTRIYSRKNLERFNLKMVALLNQRYAAMAIELKKMEHKLNENRKSGKT